MVLLFVAVGSLFLYTEVIRPGLEQTQKQFAEGLGDVLAAASPPRVLSFQGRLTNASDVPVTGATDVVFKIYSVRTGGSPLWTSKTWSVTPDQNGIFSVCLGGQDTADDCLLNGVADTAIPSTLFTDNAALYLGVTAGADSEMTPRQRIASVSYALNSDALEGFHGSQSPGANQVPILDGSGNLAFAGATTISTGGTTTLLLDPTGNLQFQTTSNYIDASGNLVIAGTLTAGSGTSAIGSGGNDFSFNTTSGPIYSGSARISKSMTLQAEYPGASLSVDDGTNNVGNMTSDVDTSIWRNFYEWSSSEASLNDYSVIVRVTLPSDFSAWQTSNAIQIYYKTEDASTTNNAVSVRINNQDDTPGTAVVTKSDAASTSWAVITIDDSEIDEGGAPDWDAAGERAVIRIKLKSKSDNFAQVGDIVLNYLAKF